MNDTTNTGGTSNSGSILDARDRMAELGTDATSAIKAGQDAFLQDRAAREPRSERRTSDSTAPGLNAATRTHEDAVR